MSKTCTKCNCEKPLDRFARRGERSNKLRTVCKDCTNAYSLERKHRVKAALKKLCTSIPRRESVFDRPVYIPPKWGR